MQMATTWPLRRKGVPPKDNGTPILLLEFPEITELTTIILQDLFQGRDEDALVTDTERVVCEEASTLLTINLGHWTEPEDFDYLNECGYYPLCQPLLENIIRSKLWRAVGNCQIDSIIVMDSYGTVKVQLSNEALKNVSIREIRTPKDLLF